MTLKTSLGVELADALDGESLEQIADWCELAVEQLGLASKDYSIGSPTWSELIDDKRQFLTAAAALRTIGGFIRQTTKTFAVVDDGVDDDHPIFWSEAKTFG